MEIPKLLIVGTENIFTENTSSSFTVRSLVENWPENRLRQIVCSDSAESADDVFVLRSSDILFDFKMFKKKVKPSSIKRNEAHYFEKGKTTIKSFIRQRLVYLYSCRPYKFTNALREFINEFGPDVIYSCSSRFGVFMLCRRISKNNRIPFVPHFFDDWPNVSFDASGLFNRWSFKLVKQTIHQAPVVFCISDLMCNEYKARYSYDNFHALMHSVNPLPKHKENESDVKTLMYAGSIYLGRYKSLVELSKAISQRPGEKVELYIYTTPASWNELGSEFDDYPFVHYGGYVSQEELATRISQSDGLVFVESFDEELLVYTRLSMSTKIPEYLSSGNPILAIGNESQGSIAYLKEHNAAYVATSEKEIPIIFNNFIDKEDYLKKEKSAQSLFENNHLNSRQVIRFKNLLIDNL